MSAEYELVKEFIKEHPNAQYHIPPDFLILIEVANTPTYIREYFEWKGQKKVLDTLDKVVNKTFIIRLPYFKY